MVVLLQTPPVGEVGPNLLFVSQSRNALMFVEVFADVLVKVTLHGLREEFVVELGKGFQST